MSRLSRVEHVQSVLNRPHSLLEGPGFGPAEEAICSDVIAGGVWGCSAAGAVREILPRRRGIGGIVAHARRRAGDQRPRPRPPDAAGEQRGVLAEAPAPALAGVPI